MEDLNDEWKPSADDAYDPAVDDAIAKHKVEAPDAYEATGTLSRSSRSSKPQLTEGVLRDMRRHGGGGAGYSGSTPINPQQLKSEAQTRNFFDRINREKLDPNSSYNLDPYGSVNAGRRATPSEEAYLNAHGSKTESQISQDIRNELYAKDPKARADSPLGIYDTENDTEEDKRINQSGEGISHTTQRWTENFKEMPEYENGDFGRLYKEQVDNFVVKNPAYKNYLNRVGYAGFQVKEINPYTVMEQVMLENQILTKPASSQPVTKEELTQRPFIPSKNNPDKFRAEKQGRIDPNNRSTWTGGEIQMDPNKIRTMGQAKARPSSYFSPITGKQEITTVFDQPQHTEQLAKLAVNNEKYNDDLKNSIWAEMIARKQDKKEKASFGDKPLPSESKRIEKIADIATSIQHFKNLLNESKKVAPNGKTEANFAENQKLRGYIDKLKKDYALELRYEPEIPNIRPTMMPLGI